MVKKSTIIVVLIFICFWSIFRMIEIEDYLKAFNDLENTRLDYLKHLEVDSFMNIASLTVNNFLILLKYGLRFRPGLVK
jgi:hypothetical protein